MFEDQGMGVDFWHEKYPNATPGTDEAAFMPLEDSRKNW